MNVRRLVGGGLMVAAALAMLAPAARSMAIAADLPKVEPELAPDKELLAKIEALGENEAMLLPKPKIVGEFNEESRKGGQDKKGPGARDFSVKTVWAPDRQRALYCGGCYYNAKNDVWEYDLAANTWVSLYPPDPGDNDPKFKEVSVLGEDGILRTARGGPVGASHTWWGIAYDPEKRMLFWLIAGHRIGKGPAQQGPELWGYSPWERKWERQTAPQGAYLPRVSNCAVALEYIPELKGSLLDDAGAFHLYDAKEKQWKKMAVQGALNVPPEQVACYDSRNKILVFHLGGGENPKENRPGSRRTGHLDIGSMKAELVLKADNDDLSMPRGSDNSAVLCYDPLSGHCLLHNLNRAGDGGEMWAYDASTRKWARLKPNGPPPPRCGSHCGDPAYFDPARNVFVVLNPNGVWVYRYKHAPTAGVEQAR